MFFCVISLLIIAILPIRKYNGFVSWEQRDIKNQLIQSEISMPKMKQDAVARKVLIAMSQEAQDMMELAENGMELEGFEGCEKVNDFLLVMHQQATGYKTFKRFDEWKKEGFSVKKGEKSKARVWGSPLKAKKQDKEQEAEPAADGKNDAEKTFKFWPMCCLFNESQVEPIEDKPETTPTKPSKKAEKPQVEKNEEPQAEEEGATGEPSPFVTTDYQEQQEARKDRMLERADKASADFQATYNRAKDMASVIPFGQPILVGHHSEKRDRRYRDKIHNTFGKAFELDSKADHYRQKAASVGNTGIASNDPEAIKKLKNKLSSLERSQKTMKAVNKIIRATKLTDEEKVGEIVAAGLLSEVQAVEILKPDYCNRVGFASYSLSNNNAEIRRTKQRIAELERLRNSDPIEFENDDFSMTVDNGRVCIEFSGGKPADDVRSMLRGSAFKWSRFQGAWVRKATANGVAEAARLKERLEAVEVIY